MSETSNTPSEPSGGEDLTGLRYERLELGGAFGYRDLMLVYEPHAQFTEWDEEYLMMSARNLIASARLRTKETAA